MEAQEVKNSEAGKTLLSAALGYGMDGFDNVMVGLMLPVIAAGLHLTPVRAASIVTATLLSSVAGGLLFGVLSDRLGRVRVMTWTILLFAVATGLCALSQGYWYLIVMRSLAGLGLGGEFGIGMALVAETWPRSKRTSVSSYVGIGGQIGPLIATLLMSVLLPFIGWRGMFVLGVAPALVAVFMRKTLHDPSVFKAEHASHFSDSVRYLVKDRETTRMSMAMAILCSVQNFGYYTVMVWLPNHLTIGLGYGVTKSSLWTSITILGMIAGMFTFGKLADSLGRRFAFIAFMVGAAVMVLVYFRLRSPEVLLVGGAVLGFFVNGMLGGYAALMSEFYPVSARATAQNVLFNIGRAIGGFSPLAIGLIASVWSLSRAVNMISCFYILDIVVFMLLVPDWVKNRVPQSSIDQ